MKLFKFLIIGLGLLILSNPCKAQEGIDTALFKELKVKKIWVWVKLPILPKRTLNDSCMVDVYEINKQGQVVMQKSLRSCYGWDGGYENVNTYDSLNRMIKTISISEGVETIYKYYYNSKNDLIKSVQTSPQKEDSFITINLITYNKNNKMTAMTCLGIVATDTSKYIYTYEYDKADNLKTMYAFTADKQLIEKNNYEFTPISKRLLEFSTETKLPQEKFTKGWNYYNIDAQLSRTQYSNNTWLEYIYKENGLLDQSLSYNMEGNLNAWKRYNYEYYEGTK